MDSKTFMADVVAAIQTVPFQQPNHDSLDVAGVIHLRLTQPKKNAGTEIVGYTLYSSMRGVRTAHYSFLESKQAANRIFELLKRVPSLKAEQDKADVDRAASEASTKVWADGLQSWLAGAASSADGFGAKDEPAYQRANVKFAGRAAVDADLYLDGEAQIGVSASGLSRDEQESLLKALAEAAEAWSSKNTAPVAQDPPTQ